MSSRIDIGRVQDYPIGQLKTVTVNGQSVVVAQVAEGKFCAVRNQCTHLPLPLGRGSLDGDTITCPWHNSQFNMCSGENLDWVRGVAGVKLPDWSRAVLALGREPQKLTTYTVVREDGKLFIET